MSKSINTRTKYKIVGSDYSAQEPRMSCFISGEPAMYDAYMNGKDLYAKIASAATGDPYEECLEFYPEGTEIEIDGKKIITGKKTHVNKHGKENRSLGKKINLASTYGMGAATAGESMGKSKEEGQRLLDNFFAGFPVLKNAIELSKEYLKKNGYVEDFLGRRRRLTDITLPKYAVFLKDQSNNINPYFNPFICCKDREYKDPKIIKWENELQKAIDKSEAFKAKKAMEEGREYVKTGELGNAKYEALAKEAIKEGVVIQANTGRIAQAERQCFNARIQGSAASLTKLAMIDVFNDDKLKELNAHLIIPVHDELLVECPAVYAEKVSQRLPEIMIMAAKKGGDDVPQSCDPYNVTRWYADTMATTLLAECKKLESSGISRDEAFTKTIKNHPEIPESSVLDVLTGKTDEVIF